MVSTVRQQSNAQASQCTGFTAPAKRTQMWLTARCCLSKQLQTKLAWGFESCSTIKERLGRSQFHCSRDALRLHGASEQQAGNEVCEALPVLETFSGPCCRHVFRSPPATENPWVAVCTRPRNVPAPRPHIYANREKHGCLFTAS